jgi:phosphate:Na+ symporter
MASSGTLIDLAGFIALLLWGTHMVQTGIQRAFGPNLKSILGTAIERSAREIILVPTAP